jgi:hypothetical protein
VGNKVALALSVLAIAVVVSACGGTQGAGLAGTGSTGPRMPPPGRARHTDPKKSCDSQGINSTQLRPGACTEGGVQYVVGNYGSVVRLKTLGVAVVGVSVSGGDQGHGHSALPRHDAFLRLTLQIQNRDSVPHRWDFGQTMLGVGGSNYLESIGLERKVHQEALATVNGGRVGPGETLRGDVVFDITRADYDQLQRAGRFFIWNFGRHAAARIPRSTGQLGQIRLYAVERPS